MKTVSDIFGTLVFDDRVMKARLPHDVYLSLKKTIDEGGWTVRWLTPWQRP